MTLHPDRPGDGRPGDDLPGVGHRYLDARTGDRDLVVRAPAGREMLPRLRDCAPALREPVRPEGCGHWTQQERPDDVSKAMTGFLREPD